MAQMDTTRPKEAMNLPWVEKYRPSTFSELISHEEIISTIEKFIASERLPHLLFYGPPGTGKTTTILAIARRLYPNNKQFKSMVLELNASDDRGIAAVRDKVITFASTKSMFCTGYKIIVLDEADAMTKDAQNALRRVVEKYSDNVRFCFICNYLSKIIPAIQSRCTRFRFGPLSEKEMVPRLEEIIKQEQVKVTEDGMESLVERACGDMRRALNILQCTSLAYDEVTEATVHRVIGQPLKADIKNMLTVMLNKPFADAYSEIRGMQVNHGLALEDILKGIHLLTLQVDFPPMIKAMIVEKLANIEYRLASACSDKVQLSAMIAAFMQARDPCMQQLCKE